MPSGGHRPNAGRPKQTAYEKIANADELAVRLDFSDTPDIPARPPKWLNPKAQAIYKATYNWLKEAGCIKGILPSLLEEFAHLKSKWHECEEHIKNHGMIVKEDGKAKPNPFLAPSQSYSKQANDAWSRIYAVVRESKIRDSDLYGIDPEDEMAKLLFGGGGG